MKNHPKRFLERVWPELAIQVRAGPALSVPWVRWPELGPNTLAVGAGTPAREGHDILVPPRPAPHLEWGGGERDGDGVEVAEVGDDHQGGLPPHALLLLIVAMVLLPLAQSCWWQAVCHPGRPGAHNIAFTNLTNKENAFLNITHLMEK